MLGHRFDGVGNNPELRAFFSRMHQSDNKANGVDEIDGAAIRHIDSETNATLVCNQSIAGVETFVLTDRPIDHTDSRTVHLLSRQERCAAKSIFLPDFSMDAIERRERFRFVARHLDAGHTQRETVNDIRPRLERREFLSRKLTVAHLPEVVVRVVRVVVLV